MTSSIHPAQQIRAKYRKYQIMALCCTIITVVAALLAALSGLQLAHLRNEQAESIANAMMSTPAPVLPQPDPALEKELETAVKRLAEAQRQMATERENVRKLMVRIAELERQLTEATNRINQLEKERLATPPPPPPPKAQAAPVAPAPAAPRQPEPAMAPFSPSAPQEQPSPSQVHAPSQILHQPAPSPTPAPAAITESTPIQMPSETQSGEPSSEHAIEPATSIAPQAPGQPGTPPGSTEIQAPAAPDVQKQPVAGHEAIVVQSTY